MGAEMIFRDPVFYGIADALGETVLIKNNTVVFDQVKAVSIGDLPIKVPLKAVSSVGEDRWGAVIFRSVGNLAILMISELDGATKVTTHILDLAKMGLPEKLMEQTRPATAKDAQNLLKKAIVKSFWRVGSDVWKEVGNGSENLDGG